MLPPVEVAAFVRWYSEFQTRVGVWIEQLFAVPDEPLASTGDTLEARIQPLLAGRLAAIDAARVRLREHRPIAGFVDELARAIAALADEVELVDARGELVQVPFRRWFELEFAEPASDAVTRLELALASTLERVRERVLEAERTLDYYALATQRYRVDADDSAADEFETTGAGRLASLIGGIDRMCGDRAQRMRLEFTSSSNGVIEAASAPYCAHRPELIHAGLAAHERRAERDRGEPLLERARNGAGTWIGRTLPITRQLRSEITELFATEPARSRGEWLALLGANADELGGTLPLGYRRLFASKPLESADLYVARPTCERACTDAIGAWTTGVPQVLFVHGDRGAGKRTMLNQVLAGVRARARVSWVRLGPKLRDTSEVARLLARVLGSAEAPDRFEQLLGSGGDPLARRSVIVVENCERLLTPSRQGLARLTEFVGMVTATTPATLWVLLMASPAAALALHGMGLASRMPTVVEVGPMTSAELELMLRARQRLSGFELDYDEPHTRLLTRATTLRPPSVAEQFHARLFAHSGGNPRQALYTWLACAREHPTREGRVVLAPLPERMATLFGPHPIAQLQLLALLARHGSLSLDELADARVQPRAAAQGDVHALWAAGLLAPTREHDQHWALCPTIAHPLALELRALNLI